MALRHNVLLFLCILPFANTLYKQWIPDTNFENATNWDKGSVPCGNDQVVFLAQRKVSVYVETAHTITGMSLPVDGELILASGAGFTVREGGDPGCGSGVTAHFKDPESRKWFDPSLWVAATTIDDLHRGTYQFSVHEESVPCQYDDVVFREGTSFRVDVSSDHDVPVKSVSVLGKKFTSSSEFSQYLSSNSGKLQFHGSSSLKVGGSSCDDSTGCICDNSGNRDRICSNVKCDSLECKKPLHPVGHCCDVCGAVVNVQFSSSFNFESYRQRLQHLFLSQHKYESIQMALSKVSKEQRLLRVIPFGATQEIQVLLLDQKTGQETGKLAEALARDVVQDVHNHGLNIGISSAEFQASSGASSSEAAGNSAGVMVGAVLGSLLGVGLLAAVVMLYRRGIVTIPRMPSIPSLSKWKNSSEIGELGGPLDHGFDNPMFDKPTMMPEEPGLYGTEMINSITLTQSGVHFVNPVYDETDFNA
ncbi:protein amnionless-like [Sinocyclocheilus grahami]|uniref:Protein amnionless n=1 Tax=Sinocyclocheilus grahami TaxID=75366 RepID=A0A672MPI9_SINGR|nr:PREDICTED: protein amnionless-like [Sinocyclocheilus grahami]